MKRKKASPPKWISKFLAWYCRQYLLESIQGDFLELFDNRRKEYGEKKSELVIYLGCGTVFQMVND